jgi:hypothetical protein
LQLSAVFGAQRLALNAKTEGVSTRPDLAH